MVRAATRDGMAGASIGRSRNLDSLFDPRDPSGAALSAASADARAEDGSGRSQGEVTGPFEPPLKVAFTHRLQRPEPELGRRCGFHRRKELPGVGDEVDAGHVLSGRVPVGSGW